MGYAFFDHIHIVNTCCSDQKYINPQDQVRMPTTISLDIYAVVRWVSMHFMGIYHEIWLQGVRWCYFKANIDDANINTDWSIFRVNILEYQCRGVRWCFLSGKYWWCKYWYRLMQISSKYLGIWLHRGQVMLLSGEYWWFKYQCILLHNLSKYCEILMQKGQVMLFSGKHLWWKYQHTLMHISSEYCGTSMQDGLVILF